MNLNGKTLDFILEAKGTRVSLSMIKIFLLSGWRSVLLFKFWMLNAFMMVMPIRERKVGGEWSLAPL